ncbi:MAG: SemiSWEET transporter [Gammaproteobacteria bacterium]
MKMNPEMFGYLAALFTTSAFLPQAVMTLRTRDTHSLSLSMYSLFTTGVIFWLLYGVYKQDIAIMAANAFTLLLASPILFIKLQNTLRRLRKT